MIQPDGGYNEIMYSIDCLNKKVFKVELPSHANSVADVYKNSAISTESDNAKITELRNILAQISQ